ncbi:MAG: septum formation initiator [Pseudonocardiaceae bacterium]|nr:septum formation initiator [Pseudonocardiaceae bacterium]
MVGQDGLAGDLERLAAAAGCELDRVDGVSSLRGRWSETSLVLLDADAAGACAVARLPRRDGVVVVAAGAAPPNVWERAVAVGAEHVATLPDAEPWLVSALADATETPARPGRVLAVLGGRGGAGSSVLAAAVAVTAAAEQTGTLLVDCDALGGGLDLVLGAEDTAGLRWPGLAMAGGRVAASSLHAALPAPLLAAGGGRLTVLSCDRDGTGPDPEAIRGVCAAGRRAGEIVVCDVPRHPCDAAGVALEAADLAVLVVPAEVRACAAAATVAARVGGLGTPLQLVVRGPSPGGLSPPEIARALDLPLLVAMRPQPGLAAALDRGEAPGRGRGPLAVAARAVLDTLDGRAGGERNAA